MLGTRTRGSRMVGADESTELWRLQVKSYNGKMIIRLARENPFLIWFKQSNPLVMQIGFTT